MNATEYRRERDFIAKKETWTRAFALLEYHRGYHDALSVVQGVRPDALQRAREQLDAARKAERAASKALIATVTEQISGTLAEHRKAL